jgi:hypothetical protein
VPIISAIPRACQLIFNTVTELSGFFFYVISGRSTTVSKKTAKTPKTPKIVASMEAGLKAIKDQPKAEKVKVPKGDSNKTSGNLLLVSAKLGNPTESGVRVSIRPRASAHK